MPYKDPERQREYMRQWIASRRMEWLKGKTCTWCGSADNLQVDHIDPGKKVDHKVWSWTAMRREAELAKCQVLCTPCHKMKTRADGEPPHGTHSRYVSRACRCTECRAAHAKTNAKYR